MPWDEALRLTTALAEDPTSHVATAVGNWEFPASREWLLLADLYDLQHRVAAGRNKPKPYRRPWRTQTRKRLTAVSAERWEEIRAELAEQAELEAG